MKKLALLTLLWALCFGARAAITTVPLTGYNADIVANGAAAPLSTISSFMTQGFDSAGYALVASDYNYSGYTPSYSLAAGGLYSSAITPGLSFQLASYSGNNALRLKANGDTSNLSFVTPQVAGALYLCGLSGSGISDFTVTVNFSDGTSQVFASQSFPDWYADGGSVVGIGRVSTNDYSTEGTSAHPSLFEIALNLDTANYTKLITGIHVEKTSSTGILGIMAVSAEDICSGSPTAGAITASTISSCTTFTSGLTLPGSTASTGINYQWQSSADSTTWTDVSGATDASYSASVSDTIFYRAIVVCTISGLSDTSAGIRLFVTAPASVVATLPFTEGFENWIGSCYTYDRPGVNWLSSPSTGNSSWRRDDQGDDASWTFSGLYMYSPASTEGSHSARFHSGYSFFGTGTMDLSVDLSPVGTKQISFDYINLSGSDDLNVQLSEDGGATFTDLGNYTTTSGWVTEILTTTSVAANAIIRFSADADYGSTDIGIDNLSIITLTACTGTPSAGAITATQYSSCSEFTPTLSLPVSTIGGITYQWQSSTDSAAWTNISGETNYTYNADVTASTYYRVYVTCTASGLSDTAAAVYLQIIVPVATVATLPFTEGFESWIGTCFTADRPGVNWLSDPASGNNSWRRNDQGSDASWSLITSYMYSPASTEGSYSARFHSGYSLPGEVGNLDLHVDLSPTGTKQITFDEINNSGSDYLTVQLSEDGGSTFTDLATYSSASGWVSEAVTTTSVAANAIIRFSATSDYGSTDIGLDNLSIVTLVPCSGTPTAGTMTVSQYTSCSEFTSNLSLPLTTIAGLTYQWQSSTDSVAWTNISGATDHIYSADVTDNIYVRAYVTCTASGLSDTTAGAFLQIVVPVATTATLPYFNGFESWIGTCFISDRPGINWLTDPATGNNSWRRDDQGADASWGATGSYMYSPASVEGSHSARFHSGNAFSGEEGNMDLHIDLSTAGTKLINFDYINTSGSDHLNIELSEDGGSTFTTLATLNTASSWTSEVVATSSVAANAIIRLNAVSDYGSTDMGLDSFSVSVAPSCSGTPVAGTFTASVTSSCVTYTSDLAVTAPLMLTGISYQWQSSADGVTFTNVSGATNTTYSADVTSNVYYRFYVACAVSGFGDTSAATELFYAPVTPVYATLPYTQGFESWVGGCYSNDRPDASWSNTPTTGNNSWRRNDQGGDASWTFAGSYMYSPASTEGSHSARFHSGYTFDGIEGDMNLYIDLSAPGTKVINFDYINLSGTDHMDVQLSEDGGTTFTTLGTYHTTSGWVPESVTTSSTNATAIIRFAGVADYGSTDIGIDSLYISVAPFCSGTPTAGTFTASVTSGCAAYTSDLSVTTPILLSGITYQWQSSADGVAYSNVSGATGTTYSASVAANTWYRFYVVCSASGLADTSAATELAYAPVVPVYASLPYFQGFENWIAGCYSFDRPGTSWVNTPTTGNASWRRDDQGSDASWDSEFGGSYSPVSVEGSHSARFHTYEAGSGDVGTLDLYVNLSDTGTKTITFSYNNSDDDFGTDELDLQISEDGGATFTTLASYFEISSGWATQTVTTTSVAAAAIIRFSATSDFGNTDIGIDSLSITSPGSVAPPVVCDSPTSISIASITSTTATATWTGVAGAGGYNYAVTTTSATPTSGTFSPINTVSLTALTPSTTYFVFVRTQCDSTDFSAWIMTTFTTPAPEGCDTPLSLSISSITTTSAAATWSAVAGAAEYQYGISTSSAAPVGPGIPTTLTTATFTSLTPATTYYVFVRTECASGDSSVWMETSFTTAATPPPACDPATGLTVSAITDSTAILSWHTVASAVGYEYIVNTSAADPSGVGTVTADTVVTDTTLACNTVYYLHVRTDCSATNAIWSTTTFTTPACPVNSVNNVNKVDFAVAAYPNPVTSMVKLEVTGTISGTASVQLTDVTGKTIQTIQLSGNTAQIDMSNLASGIYFLNYSDSINNRTLKVNKQ